MLISTRIYSTSAALFSPFLSLATCTKACEVPVFLVSNKKKEKIQKSWKIWIVGCAFYHMTHLSCFTLQEECAKNERLRATLEPYADVATSDISIPSLVSPLEHDSNSFVPPL